MLEDYESAVKDMRNLTQDRGIANAAIYAHMAAAYLGMLEKAEAAGDAEATQGYFDEAKTYSTAARKIVLTDETRALESLDRIEARMSLFEARYSTDC